jgi:hypothetical protein
MCRHAFSSPGDGFVPVPFRCQRVCLRWQEKDKPPAQDEGTTRARPLIPPEAFQKGVRKGVEKGHLGSCLGSLPVGSTEQVEADDP